MCKNISFLSICLLFLFISSSFSQQMSPTGVFLLGGGLQDTTSSIYNYLKSATGKPNPKIAVVISGAPSLADGLDAYYVPIPGSNSYEKLFEGYGFTPSVIELAIDNYLTASSSSSALGRENILKIQEADVVFFNGGDQSRHTRAWLNDDESDSDIMKALKDAVSANRTIISGTSAGLAVQSDPLFGSGTSYGYYYYNADLKVCKIGEELADDRGTSFRYDENGASMKGFGFIQGALVDSHYDARGRFVRLAVAMKQFGKSYGIGVDEDTGFYVENNIGTVVGSSGVWVIDSSNADYLGYYFGANNLKIHYLTQGDSYDFSTKRVVTTKSVLVEANGNPHSSTAVFRADEAVKSMTSLVSTRSSQVICYSSERGPETVVTFKKSGETKAYFQNDKYTIESLLMDVGSIE